MVPIPGYPRYLMCPWCGSQVSATDNYCSYCGTALRPQRVLKICPRCKNRIPLSAKFCPECGQKQ